MVGSPYGIAACGFMLSGFGDKVIETERNQDVLVEAKHPQRDSPRALIRPIRAGAPCRGPLGVRIKRWKSAEDDSVSIVADLSCVWKKEWQKPSIISLRPPTTASRYNANRP